MSDITTAKMLRDAFESNCKVLADSPNWGATVEETKKYISNKVDDENPLSTPLEYFRQIYNMSVDMLRSNNLKNPEYGN